MTNTKAHLRVNGCTGEGVGDPARIRVLIKSAELEISTRKNGGLKNSV